MEDLLELLTASEREIRDTKADIRSLASKVEAHQDIIMACKEKLMAMIMVKESAAVAENQKVPFEEAAVETVGGPEGRSGDQQPVVGRRNAPKRRAEEQTIREAPKRRRLETSPPKRRAEGQTIREAPKRRRLETSPPKPRAEEQTIREAPKWRRLETSPPKRGAEVQAIREAPKRRRLETSTPKRRAEEQTIREAPK
jgi:hypothetical protein